MATTSYRALLGGERHGAWIQTLKGRAFWPEDPRPGDFDILEIAHALSNICRFNGHVSRFMSVAEHSVWVSMECDPGDAFEGLMHDAAEAYIGDVVRPLKRCLGDYREIEQRVELALAEQFDLRYPWPDSVRRADDAVLMAERRDLLIDAPDLWPGILPEPMDRMVEGWSPEVAKGRFCQRYLEIRTEATRPR